GPGTDKNQWLMQRPFPSDFPQTIDDSRPRTFHPAFSAAGNSQSVHARAHAVTLEQLQEVCLPPEPRQRPAQAEEILAQRAQLPDQAGSYRKFDISFPHTARHVDQSYSLIRPPFQDPDLEQQSQ